MADAIKLPEYEKSRRAKEKQFESRAGNGALTALADAVPKESQRSGWSLQESYREFGFVYRDSFIGLRSNKRNYIEQSGPKNYINPAVHDASSKAKRRSEMLVSMICRIISEVLIIGPFVALWTWLTGGPKH